MPMDAPVCEPLYQYSYPLQIEYKLHHLTISATWLLMDSISFDILVFGRYYQWTRIYARRGQVDRG